ncbi:MAG: 3'-5' exonuclease [Desulforhopalus sp.]
MFPPFGISRHRKLNWAHIMAECRKNVRDSRLRDFYAAFVLEENQPIEAVPFVALDFETTGLDPISDDIISIGLINFNLRKVYCSLASHWLIHPRQPLAEHSIVVHGITHSEIDEAPDLESILEEVLTCLAGKMIVVHYNCIERDFLNWALMTRLNEGICFPVIDTMAIEAFLHRRRRKNFWQHLKGDKPVSLRLVDCRERYNLPPHQAHNALADAIATAELFLAQVAHHYSGRTTLAELWT